MREFDFLRASSVEEAGQLLHDRGGKVIAGGTDLLPRLQRGADYGDTLLDISALDELRFIRERENRIEIGALSTYADLLDSSLLRKTAVSLIQAAETVGCPQTRSRGTIGGNIMNASPAGDALPPLLTYDARVKLLRKDQEISLPLAELFSGPGQTRLQGGDLLLSVSFPKPAGDHSSLYLKLGNRKGMNIAVASVALWASFADGDRFDEVRAALGSVAPTPVRSPHAESVLSGAEIKEAVLERAAEAVGEDISPITDVRASAARRREAAAVLLKRALKQISQERVRHG